MRGAARALEGIPTSVKDEDAIAGLPVDGGRNAHKRQPGDIPVVDKLLVAGAVLHAQTKRPGVLFHSAGPGARPLGVTRNPWNLRITWAIGRIYPRAPPDQRNDRSTTQDCSAT